MATTASDDMKTPTMAATAPSTKAPQTSSTDHRDGAGKTGFTSLPEELVSNIAVKLGSDDMFALRLTCRDLEAKSLHEFAIEYFSAKCFMFTTESLKTLVNIAKSQKLRHLLQKVYLITASVTDRQVKCCKHGNCMWDPTVREHEAFVFYKNDQKRLYDEGGDKTFLTEAFASLPRMQKLILVDEVKGLPAGVKCHGLTKFRRTTNISPSFKPLDSAYAAEYYPWLTHVFRTMMLAVAESGITTIKHLATDLHLDYRTLDGLSPLTDLQFKTATLTKLTKAFGNLSQLGLCFRSHSLRVGKNDSPENLKQVAHSAKAFGRVLSNVTSLELNFDMGKWSGPILRILTSNMDLSKLTTFSLDSVLIDMKAFAQNIICRLQSAQNITLTLAELKEGSWVPILKAFQALPQLNHLHMRYLQEDGHKCFFLEKPDGDDEEDDLTEPSWFDPLTGEMGGGDDEEDDSDDWADEEEDGESMPDLIEQDGIPLVQDTVDASPSKARRDIPAPTQDETPSQDAPNHNDCPHHTGKDHRAPGMRSGERGYHICLQGEEIKEQLPKFIKEYNLGGNSHDDLDFGGLLGNLAQQMPPGIAGMGGTFAIPIPVSAGPPPPPPPAPGAQAPQGGPPPPAGVPPMMLGGLYSLLGGGPIQGPFGSTLTTAPPPPGAAAPTAPGAANGQATTQGQGSNAASSTTATSNATADADPGEHEEGWWDEGELVQGDLDDVD